MPRSKSSLEAIPGRKRKSNTKFINEEDEDYKDHSKHEDIDRTTDDIESVLRKNKLVDADLDFSQDPDIPEKTFINEHIQALKKVNSRANPLILQYLANLKWEKFHGKDSKSRAAKLEGIQQTSAQARGRHSRIISLNQSQESENNKTRTEKTRGHRGFKTGRLSRITQNNQDENDLKQSRKDKKQIKQNEDEPQAKRRHKVVSETDSETSSHNDVCEYCEKSGELLLCDFCNSAFHLECLGLKKEDLPDGEYECPLCVEDRMKADAQTKPKPGRKATTEKVEEEICYQCSQNGASITCRECSRLFHITCTFPPLKEVPADWKCQYCRAEPLRQSIDKILFFKYVDMPIKDDEGKVKATYQIKKYLVKYVEYSYWDVEWVDEFQMKSHSFMMFSAFNRKNDMTTSMCYEDTEIETVADSSDPVIDIENIKESDLYDTFYRYGIKAEWLEIHRIIAIEKKKDQTMYLVKWRDLPYTSCTWENRKEHHLKNICNIKKHIDDFKRNISEAINRPLKFPENNLVTKNYIPYERTPDFLSTSNGTLHQYQLEGLNWIRFSCFNKTNVILADEMGLGKTIQSIAFLYSLFKENISCGPFLVVAPLSTLPNWEREFELWAPDFYVITLSMTRENREMIKDYEFYIGNCYPNIPKNSQKNYKFHVLLVSYEIINIEASILKKIKWCALVLDEAHKIKNRQSKLHQMLTDYRFQFKLLLTGTPLQNNLEELFFLLNFLCPKEFDNVEAFTQEFKDLGKEKQTEKLHALVKSRLLRRLKSDVLKDIPIKSEIMVPVDLCPVQKKYYRAILTRNYSTLVQRSVNTSSMLNILMELKKCCNHPYLFNLSPEEQPYNEETGMYEYEKLVSSSAKMILLDKILTGLHKMGHRVLIFSQMTKLLDLVEDYLNQKDWKFERIDGSVNTMMRQASIDRFNSKDSQSFVFLLSTRAGGLGINLATADTVIIYDSDWNPHNDIQALSRAHRMGQLKKVMIYRFFTRNSVEERILEVAKKKMMLTHLVVTAGLGKNQNMSKSELEDIVKFGTAQLFTNSGDANQLEYDDEAIDKLLNRDIHTSVTKESGLDEYFSSFKIVDVAVKQPIVQDPDKLAENEALDSQKYWSKLLKTPSDIEQIRKFEEFGKGKRLRKQIKYVEHDGKHLDEEDVDPDYDIENRTTSESSSEDTEEGDDEINEDGEVVPKPHAKKESLKLPLFSTSGANQNTTLEWNRKRNIINKLNKYGMPNPDVSFTYYDWEMDKEENFTLEDFKSYIRNVFSSLDYAGSKFIRHYDKFPLEDTGCQSILARISLIELIKSKVLQYAPLLPYMLPLLVENHMVSIKSIQGDYLTLIKPYLKAQVEDIEKTSHLISPPLTHHDLQSTNSTFLFNIEDHNYTELHFVWEREQSETETNIWWRYHDLWLLLGICIHGYNEFDAIFSDPRFHVLNFAFENSKEDKKLFSRRRLDHLEQALVVEDVISRTMDQKITLKPESNIIKFRNKILEINCLLEAGLPVAENYTSQEENKRVLKQLFEYTQQVCMDLKNESPLLPRYILNSSLRAVQLFPLRNLEKYSTKTIGREPLSSTIPSISANNENAQTKK